MATDDSPFLSRWSRRKVQAREGVPVEPAPPEPKPAAAALPSASTVASTPAALNAQVPLIPHAPLNPQAPSAQSTAQAATAPALTLDDVARLTRESDYSGFVAHGVTPEVRNAALKKLFTDPHFNVMDGLDTYIADYGQPDPLPEGMLRQMVQSQFLGLFDDDPPAGAEPVAQPVTEAATDLGAAAATALPATAPPLPTPADEDADLQLQPDHAAGRAGADAGAGQDAGRQH